MTERKGEKIGWLVGWLGGFLWVAILSVVFLVQHKVIAGISGIVLFCASLAAIFLFAPWRHPAKPYWRLMLPIYFLVIGSIVWAVWAYGGLKVTGLSPYEFIWFVVLLLPFGTIGKKTWENGQIKNDGEGLKL